MPGREMAEHEKLGTGVDYQLSSAQYKCLPTFFFFSSPYTTPLLPFSSSPSSCRQLLHITFPTTNMSEMKPDSDSTEPSTASHAQSEETPKDTAPAATSYVDMASNAAGSATSAAAGVKDSVFSMFGGGAKKEKKEEPEGETEDRSGSSKAKKDAEAAEADEGGDVRPLIPLAWPSSRPLTT